MPTFEFTSPDGETMRGEGESPEDAFGRALQTLGSRSQVGPRYREPGGPPSVQEALDAPRSTPLERFNETVPPMVEEASKFIPGTQVIRDLREGQYPEAARDAALTALPFGLSRLAPGARALAAGGMSMLNSQATAGSMFEAEPDVKKRKALEKQYEEAGPRGKIQILHDFNEQQGTIAREKRDRERLEHEREETNKRREDWFNANADAINSLQKQDRDTIHGAGSLEEAQSLFSAAMERRRQAKMTLAERYPPAVLGGELLGTAADAYIPGRLAGNRVRRLEEATARAESALPKKATTALSEEAQLARDKLKERAKVRSVSPLDVGLGLGAPYIAGNIPNGIDMLMGQLSSDPDAKEKIQKAWENATDPVQFLRSLAMGAGGTTLGLLGASAFHDMGGAKADARGVLNRFSAREEALKRAEAAKAQARLEKTAAKSLARREQATPDDPIALSRALRASGGSPLAPEAPSALSQTFNPLQQNE